ncbi:hypothetical protein AB0N33_17915 [Pseudarthrobacter oxydans]|uniref:hypothetical protein n=1 Tax=Pseudarthrobacter oxydans TaxID=1671 RepID=UPI003440D548
MVNSAETSEPTPRRALLAILYVTLLAALAVPAIGALYRSPYNWGDGTKAQAVLLIAVPSVVLLWSVLSARHSLAWSIYWTWSLVFLGLAAVYQMSANAFPWKGVLLEEHINTAQRIILLAHATVFLVALIARPSARPGQVNAPPQVQGFGDKPQLKKLVMLVMSGHILVAALFCALMGPTLFTGRLAFQSRLVGMDGLPGFGSMYFLSNAGAIIIPAMVILLRKSRLDIPKFGIFLSIAVSFLATNPLIGSRFLTGSFLVAVVAASVGAYARRWIPFGTIAAFVTLFPTLDLLRGDGTGATQIELTPPDETLTTFDYDSFEMLVREVSVQGNLPGGLPSSLELLIAPFLRWIPVLSQTVLGDASGPVVAKSSGMTFTNVSMPLWGESHLIGSWAGVVIAFCLFGLLLARTTGAGNGQSIFGPLIETPTAALLFIILRGSLYEVLGYLLLAAAIALAFANAERRDRLGIGINKPWTDPYPAMLHRGQ